MTPVYILIIDLQWEHISTNVAPKWILNMHMAYKMYFL